MASVVPPVVLHCHCLAVPAQRCCDQRCRSARRILPTRQGRLLSLLVLLLVAPILCSTGMGIPALVAEIAPTSYEISARICAVSLGLAMFTCRVPIATRTVPTLLLIVPLAAVIVSPLLFVVLGAILTRIARRCVVFPHLVRWLSPLCP